MVTKRSCSCSNPYSESTALHPHLWLLDACTLAGADDHVSYQAWHGCWHGWIVWIAGFGGNGGLETKRVHPQRWISIRFRGRARCSCVSGWMAGLLYQPSKTKRCFMTSNSSGGIIQLPLYLRRELVLQRILSLQRFGINFPPVAVGLVCLPFCA